MRPILFEIGNLSIYSYGFFVALGIAVATLWMIYQSKKWNKTPDIVLDCVLIAVISGVIGARLFYVFLYEADYYLDHPLEILFIQQGGLAFYGGLLTGLLAVVLYLLIRRIPVLSFLDFAAPATALGYVIARFGCFMNGCCYGMATTLPWGVVFPAVDGLTRHPTQIYSMLAGLLIFIILVWKSQKGIRFPGQLFSLFLILYGLFRSVIELFRENTELAGGPSEASLVALLLSVMGGVLYGFFYFLSKRVKGIPPQDS
mgnify:CR=1 FL=1